MGMIHSVCLSMYTPLSWGSSSDIRRVVAPHVSPNKGAFNIQQVFLICHRNRPKVGQHLWKGLLCSWQFVVQTSLDAIACMMLPEDEANMGCTIKIPERPLSHRGYQDCFGHSRFCAETLQPLIASNKIPMIHCCHLQSQTRFLQFFQKNFI